ncbi:MAG: GNAT family N-acetyltransferase [Eubacterium sp.]
MSKIIFITSDSDDFQLVKNIRVSVFTAEQGADADTEFDSYDEKGKGTLYALLYDRENAAATSRLALTEKGFKIGRIAVLKQYRGKGYGDKIVRAVVEKAFEKGAQTVLVDAQNYAVPFYEKFGFKAIGSQIIDRGLPHMPMSLDKNNYR